MKILIVGGGIAGSTLASWPRRAGHSPDIPDARPDYGASGCASTVPAEWCSDEPGCRLRSPVGRRSPGRSSCSTRNWSICAH